MSEVTLPEGPSSRPSQSRRDDIVSRRNKFEKILTHYNIPHMCTLPPVQDPIVFFITDGCFVYLRRKFRRMCVVYANNPRTKVYLKSRTAIRSEIRRHMKYHRNILHPFSLIRIYWDVFMTCVLTFYLVITAVSLLCQNAYIIQQVNAGVVTDEFLERTLRSRWEHFRLYVLLPIIAIDIVMSFCTGFCKYDTKEIILSFKEVFKHNVTHLFLVEVAGVTPWAHLIFYYRIAVERDFSYMYLYHCTYITNLILVVLLFVYVNRVKDWKNWNNFTVGVAKLTFLYLLAILWMSVYLFVLDTHESLKEDDTESSRERYVPERIALSFSWCVSSLLLIGLRDVPSKSTICKMIHMSLMCLGMVLKFVMITFMSRIVSKYTSSSANYDSLKQELREFIHYKQLPDYLKKRIFHYFQFRFPKIYLKEDEIWDIMSEHLKQEVLTHTSRHIMEKVHFFNHLPHHLLILIGHNLRREVYMPNDVIVYAGRPGDTMFFIKSGTVAVYIKSGKELCHLEDGAHFGEIALVMESERRTASVVAVEPCEIFLLHRKQFQKAVQPYPNLYNRVKKSAVYRLQKTIEALKTEPDHLNVLYI